MKPARPSVESGICGPCHEIRTYGIKPGGVQPTIDLWAQAMPALLTTAMTSMIAMQTAVSPMQ